MPRETTRKNTGWSRAKSISVLIVAILILGGFSYWAYWSYYIVPTGQAATSQSSTQLQVTSVQYQNSDFSLSISNGCETINQTTGENTFIFYATISSNQPVHFLNAYAAGDLEVLNGTKQSTTFTSSVNSPTYTNQLTLNVTFPASDVPKGSLVILTINVTAHATEVNGAILKSSLVRISQTYPTC